jgi:hypothetical protein
LKLPGPGSVAARAIKRSRSLLGQAKLKPPPVGLDAAAWYSPGPGVRAALRITMSRSEGVWALLKVPAPFLARWAAWKRSTS